MKHPRFLVVHLPAFRLERCGFAASDLAALTAEEKSAVRLVALTPAARRAGLSLGTTATEARALVPEIALVPFDSEGEAEDRRALHHAFLALSDRVAVPWSDALVADVSWLAESEEVWVARAEEIASSLGHVCTVAVAGDPLAALALAQCGTGGAVPEEDLGSALAGLSLAALRPDEALAHDLLAVGIETVGQLAALDPGSVRGRYGDRAARLHRVARGLPASAAILDWGPQDDTRPIVAAPLPGATSITELRFVVPGLVAQLAARLAAHDRAVVRMRIVLRLETRVPVALRVRIGRPTRSPRALERLVTDRLQRVRVEAPIEELVLEVEESVFDRGWQPGLTDRAEATEPLPDLVARLCDQIGDAAVFRAVLADRWRPEAAWEPAPFLSATLVDAQVDRIRQALDADDPVEVQGAFEQPVPFPRPSLLLPKRVPIEVACDGERPVRIAIDGAWCAVRAAVGPERLFGEWWEPDGGFDRTYWKVAIDGGREAWIVRDRADRGGPWSLHGWFD